MEFTHSEASKQVLGLKLPTDPRWVDMANMSLEDILTDHAYCEQKAATSFISLIINYPECRELVRELAPVVTEEWGHFRMVLKELDKRGLTFGVQRRDDYVNALRENSIKGGSREQGLVEKLLMFALVEARSCERFRLLSLHIPDEDLREFYHKFMIAEAGHYKLFLELAKLYYPEEKVMARWRELLAFEADLLTRMEPRGDRMH